MSDTMRYTLTKTAASAKHADGGRRRPNPHLILQGGGHVVWTQCIPAVAPRQAALTGGTGHTGHTLWKNVSPKNNFRWSESQHCLVAGQHKAPQPRKGCRALVFSSSGDRTLTCDPLINSQRVTGFDSPY